MMCPLSIAYHVHHLFTKKWLREKEEKTWIGRGKYDTITLVALMIAFKAA